MAVINLVNVVLLISFISTYWSPVLGDLIVWPRETVVVAGQSVQLDCSTDDKYNVNWWHVPVGSTTNEDVFISGIVVLPYHPRFKVEKNRIANSLTEFHLVITSVSREDAGKYTCIDRAGHGEQRGSQLIVLASATLVVKPRNTSALVQHRVQLDCSTSKLTAPVRWQYLPVGGGGGEPQDVFINGILLNGYKKRFQIQENMTTGAYNLVIPSVQFSDAGTYRCRDEDGRGEHVDANLHITENTDLRLMPEYAETQVGERVQLNCTTYYKTEPVNWQHIPLGKSLPVDVYLSGDFRNNYTTGYDAQMDKETGINSLIIMKVNIGDGGLFRCIERQGLGQHKDANLTVIEITDLRLTPEYAEAQVGERVQLNCTTYYKTEPVNWQHIPLGKSFPVDVYFSGNFLNNYTTGYDAQTDKETGINSLIIMKVNFGDGGLFRCVERQGLGQHKDANLTVIDQTEDFDSSTYTYEPVTPKSSTGNNQNNLWALLVLIVVPIGILIAVVVYKNNKKERTADKNKHQLQKLRTTDSTQPESADQPFE